ncbi:MAG: AAA family ATPase [Candidatus Moranbacteria bacterium]|nr:AAA family ATPase [Candidatus Moranbacteria bacterium]
MSEKQGKIIIGIAGEIASGKDTVSRYYQKKHGASMYRFSDVLRDILRRLHLEENRKNLAASSLMLRETFGEDIFARSIAEEIENDGNDLIVIDGVRRSSDVKSIQGLLGFTLLYINVDPKRRHERMTSRDQNADDTTKTFEEFLQDSELESETEIRKLAEEADFTIDNNGSLDELYVHADALLAKLRESGRKSSRHEWSWKSLWKK